MVSADSIAHRSGQLDKVGVFPLLLIPHPETNVQPLILGFFDTLLGPLGPDTDLQRWGRGIAKRGGKRGKKRAVVAVARKLAILLLALWKSGAKYEPLKNSKANGEEQNKFRVKSQAAA